MTQIMTRRELKDGNYMELSSGEYKEFIQIEYFNSNARRDREDGPAMSFNQKNNKYLEWWENGKLIAVFQDGMLSKTDNGSFTDLYEVQVPEKWKNYEQTLSLHDLGFCYKPELTNKNETVLTIGNMKAIANGELPPAAAVTAVAPKKTDNRPSPVFVNSNESSTISDIKSPEQLENLVHNINLFTDENKPVATSIAPQENNVIKVSNFKERLAEIKKQRMASEEMLLNSKIEKLADFDVEKRLTENEMFAKKDLFINKILGTISSAIIVGSVGAIVIGAVGIAATPVSIVVALGGVFMAGTGIGFLGVGGVEMFESASKIFKSTKTHNMDLIEEELVNLRDNINAATVNRNTTVKDFFKASKESIIDNYNQVIETSTKLFKPLSEDDISERIKGLRQLKTLGNNITGKSKPT